MAATQKDQTVARFDIFLKLLFMLRRCPIKSEETVDTKKLNIICISTFLLSTHTDKHFGSFC